MTTPTVADVNGMRLAHGALPGAAVPYHLASGEGLRFETAGQLWTVIARTQDTGGAFDAAYVTGPRGAESPLHAVPDVHRTFAVLNGQIRIWLGDRSRVLGRGDAVQVPPGTPFGYRMLSELSRMLMYSAPGGALDALLASDAGTRSFIYSARRGDDALILPEGASREPLPAVPHADADDAAAWEDALPAGEEPYVLRGLEGDHRAWPDAVNSYVSRGRNTGGRYFAVHTLAAPQPYIIQHFHRLHTENFFCLSGRVWLWVNGEEVLLTEGDFVHAPAGTIHSFAIGAHHTRMLGILSSDVFEPFFDVTSEHTADRVYTEGLVNPSVIMGGIQGAPDLDLQVVGPPPQGTAHSPQG
ncbi:quercetin 2,3-dioxygenase [Leucobacter allii]|uniref:Quercetin 2,3-dioxygenase n=1 Tax=Leucobacter allii TaxID=2932247 RepID=A0ABY4FMH2_9MICO|nr:quercetin 2,3-dioxygenase [Leucobacter allii]UOQ57420.1 quercetin 2,3-dioxygenase [Leucobacter allii]